MPIDPMAETPGERIAAEYGLPHHRFAAAIDKAVAEAREEGCTEGRLSAKRALQELMRVHSELRGQFAAKEAALRNIAGDNLCWITDSDQAKALPEVEFMESCRRHRQQIADERGEFTGGRTIAQLEKALAAKEADCAAMRLAIGQLKELATTASNADCDLTAAPPSGVMFGTELPPHRSYLDKAKKAWRDFDAVLNAALASNAGEALLARLRALESLVPVVEKLLGSINADQSQLDTSSNFERNYRAVADTIEAARAKEPSDEL